MKNKNLLSALRKKMASDHALIMYLNSQIEALEATLQDKDPLLYQSYQEKLYEKLQSNNVQEIMHRRDKLEE